ncbi:MAG: RNA polymerase sigma factor [Actinobacteria bacterium]|nr:MAG: RNA polymerase sigma factor [Actinomycetota bacterium]
MAGRTERAYVQDPDPRTLARAREGDLGAFEELVRQYQADVWRFAFHFTRDRSLAEDVTQEAFLIARNCAMDALRSRKSTMAKEPPPPVGPPDPEARLELAAALSAVTDEHRQPFLLIEVFGLSYQEAADVLNLRVGTVKSRMHRARQAMMSALAVEEDAGGL